MGSEFLKPPVAPYWSELYPQAELPTENNNSLQTLADGMRLFFRKNFRSQYVQRRLHKLTACVNAQSRKNAKMKDAELQDEINVVRSQLRLKGLGGKASIRAIALVREICFRTLDLRPYDVQILGGWALMLGMLAEMETGEGKTLTALAPTIVSALAGVPVHVFTVNDYLAQRDAAFAEPILDAFGLTKGVIVEGLDEEERRQAYCQDVVYGTNKQIVFDYLRDRTYLQKISGELELKTRNFVPMAQRNGNLLLRGLHCAIVDEADSILIDEARTPLILSKKSKAPEEALIAKEALRLASGLTENAHYRADMLERHVVLNDKGKQALRETPGPVMPLLSGKARREEAVSQALFALHLLNKGEHYIIQDEKVQIVDEYTGRVMKDRHWSRGIQQMVEIKEGLEPSDRSDTIAQITYQRFFRRYRHLCGMSGTAREVEGELWKVYRLPLAVIPPRVKNRRKISSAKILPTKDDKWKKVAAFTLEQTGKGRAVLIGTRTVSASFLVSQQLIAAGIEHQVLNAEHHEAEAEIIAQAGKASIVTVATNMAGRGTDIKLDKSVIDQGGLIVILTERHDSRRIDRQLIGRCARQGDPGEVKIFLSLEDELLASGSFSSFRAALLPLINLFPNLGRFSARLLFDWSQSEIEQTHARIRASCVTRDRKVSELMAFAGTSE